MPSLENLVVASEAPRRSAAGLVGRILLHLVSLLVGVAALVAYQHFSLEGNSTASLASLVAAAGFGLSPLRLLLHEIFAAEGKVLHLAHGLGGLSLIGLTLGGVVPGGPLRSHAAMAPL